MIMRIALFAVFVVTQMQLSHVVAADFATAPYLPLCEARGIAQAIYDAIQTSSGSPSVITVLDNGANPVLSLRMDGAINVADSGALMKARMTAMLHFPSGAGANFNFTPPFDQTQFPIFEPGQSLFKVDEHLELWGLGGAFPIYRNGTVVGAVGVSGAPSAAGDVMNVMAGSNVVNCLSSLAVNASKYPRLADAVARVVAAETVAQTLTEKKYANIVVDELGRVVLGARMDSAPLISYSLALMKARTAQQLGVNSTLGLFQQGAFDPFHASFSLDNADINLNKCPGGNALWNAAGAVVGAFGSSGASDPITGDQVVANAGSAATALVLLTPTLSLANAYGALQAGLNTAFSLGWTVSIAIVDAVGAPKLFYSTAGSVPASMDHAQGKARMAVHVPFPPDVIFPLMHAQANIAADPPTLYNIANAAGGLVAYSGWGTIRDAVGNVIGGVGVFSEGNMSVDNWVVAAAVAGAANALAPSSFTPPAFTTAMVDPLAPKYAAANVYSPAAHAACWAGLSSGSENPAACVSRDPRGKINVIVVQDGACQAAARFADRTSHGAFAFPWPSEGPGGFFQQAFNPINGSYFTGANSEEPRRSVVAPGGQPLTDSSGLLVGSIGFGSLPSASSSLDVSTADAAVKATAGKQAFELRQVSCVGQVQQYWAALAQGNFSRISQLITSDFQLYWPGDKTVLPMAGRWNGTTGLEQFFGVVGKYFTFTFCPSTPGPQISSVSATAAYAYWEECSPFVNTNTVPCPDNLNQALYTCDATTMKIQRAQVNIDNECIAEALGGNSSVVAPAASSGFISKLTVASYAGSVAGGVVLGGALGVAVAKILDGTKRRFKDGDAMLN
jgi:uncharacterized protein GlcG (DUF336 family)